MIQYVMRKISKKCLLVCLGTALFGPSLFAAEKAEFKDEKEKASYSVGVNFGRRIKQAGFDVDMSVVSAAMNDVIAGKEPRLNDAEAQQTLMAYQQAAQKQQAEKNTKAGEAFLAENKKKEGVKAHTVTLPDGKTAEMQYKVLTAGTGKMPGSNDVVRVHYRGTLVDGKEFDSSAKRGQPAEFAVNRVIPGWTAALQIMKVGSKWELYIPSVLAYGERGMPPNIDPGSTLIFEVELLSAEPPQPPPQPSQPLTSDIIRVPSADELKKGAQIQVIKQEDLEKAQKSELEKQKSQPK